MQLVMPVANENAHSRDADRSPAGRNPCMEDARLRALKTEDVSKWTQRFLLAAAEKEYVDSLLNKLIGGLAFCSCVVVVICCAVLGLGFAYEAPTEEAARLNDMNNVLLVVVMAFSTIVAIVSKFDKLVQLLCYRAWEQFVAMSCNVFLLLSVCVNPYYMTKMHGLDPHEVHPDVESFSDEYLILCMLGVVFASHVLLPVRWVALVSVEIFSIVLYACVAFMIGSPHCLRATVGQVLLFVCLILCVAKGKRQLEFYERCNFIQLLEEKLLRCQAEFKLSQTETTAANGSPAPSKVHDPHSEMSFALTPSDYNADSETSSSVSGQIPGQTGGPNLLCSSRAFPSSYRLGKPCSSLMPPTKWTHAADKVVQAHDENELI